MTETTTTFQRHKALSDLQASIVIMDDNIKLFHGGNQHTYRVIAGELRKLLCDGASTLLVRIFPDIKLHPLFGSPSQKMFEDEVEGGVRLTFMMPSHVVGVGGNHYVERMFDENLDKIALNDWLSQPLFNREITLREFIRSVADKESIHSDRNYNDTLLKVRSYKLFDSFHQKHIIAIGEYMIKIMSPMYLEEVKKFNSSQQ